MSVYREAEAMLAPKTQKQPTSWIVVDESIRMKTIPIQMDASEMPALTIWFSSFRIKRLKISEKIGSVDLEIKSLNEIYFQEKLI